MTMESRSSERAQLQALSALFHSLSDVTRLAIISRLRVGEARVVDLVKDLGLAQSTVSAHLACLRGCGLVVARPQGRQMFYSLTASDVVDLLGDAEAILERTHQAVLDCPIFGESS